VAGETCIHTTVSGCEYKEPFEGLYEKCTCTPADGQENSWVCERVCPADLVPDGSACYPMGGITCTYTEGGGSITCSCLNDPPYAWAYWQCSDIKVSECQPYPVSGGPCTPPSSWYPCVYPEPYNQSCRCEPVDTVTNVWICNDLGCDKTPPLGTCTSPIGQTCTYEGGATVCQCEAGNPPFWSCNGIPTQPCPAEKQDDCTNYPIGACCIWEGAAGGPGWDKCTCTDGPIPYWQCDYGQGGGGPPG
jgi:hypothetical protein